MVFHTSISAAEPVCQQESRAMRAFRLRPAGAGLLIAMLLAPVVIGMAVCWLASLSLALTNLTAGEVLTLAPAAVAIPYVSLALHEVGQSVCGLAALPHRSGGPAWRLPLLCGVG